MSFSRVGVDKTYLMAILVAVFVLNASIIAQTPMIFSSSPSINELNVETDVNITVTFDVDMDPSTINESTFVVYSKTFGLLSGVINYNPSTKTTTYDPNDNFKVGEIITVILTDSITSMGGTPIDHGYVWTFTVEVHGGTGIFMPADNSEYFGSGSSVSTGDVNQDKLPDIVFNVGLPYDEDYITVQYNNGSGSFPTGTTYPTIDFPWSVVLVDLDKTNGLDIAISNAGSRGASVILNNGDGTFGNSIYYPMINCEGLCYADLNGDSYYDLIFANVAYDKITVLVNGGDGTFNTRIEYETEVFPRSVCAADIDNDRDMDIVVVCHRSDNFQIFKNNGNGDLSLHLTIPTSFGPSFVTSADVDNDNDLDILTAQSAEGDISIYFNEGDGNLFTPQNISYDVSSGSIYIQPVDLEGDGDLDLVTANMSYNNVYTFYNDGVGSFLLDSAYSTGPIPFTISSCDLEDDGDMDFVVATYNIASANCVISILRNGVLYMCGDVNESGALDFQDLVYYVEYIFNGGSAPIDISKMDVDSSGDINVTDLVCLVNYLMKNGPEPNCN